MAWQWIDLDETKQLMDGVSKDESMAADDLASYDLDKLHFYHRLITPFLVLMQSASGENPLFPCCIAN
ncbi:hypothetical protein [Moorena sp. SIO4G3]|uniref:hypothetical protein n=1 Tax=Moorena sp. SIO4G3 TaxID=2607821 RepID=UPI0014294D07|nr:hypothetical protein [Moorena sp. SIO4G3]NEO79983.1 hypothetical protein [Moorena sp. SIO4G3]